MLQIVQTVALIVGIVYYISIMRNQQKTRELTLESQELTRKAQEHAVETRQAQLAMQVVNQWIQPSMFESRAFYTSLQVKDLEHFLEIWEKPETNKLVRTWGGYCEGMGVLVRQGYLDIKIIAHLMGGVVKSDWERIGHIIPEWRERWGIPRGWIE